MQLCGGGELGLKPANLQVCRLARVVAQLQAQIRKFSLARLKVHDLVRAGDNRSVRVHGQALSDEKIFDDGRIMVKKIQGRGYGL